MPLADIKNIPSFESTVFEQGSPDDDAPFICKKDGHLVVLASLSNPMMWHM
jgi:hypothetical protein